MKYRLKPEALFLLVAAAVVLVPLLLLGGYVVQKHQYASARLQEVEPRYARLLGLQQSEKELADAQAATQALLARHVYPVELDASQTGNAVQQRTRDLFTKAGLQVVSSQVLPSKAEGPFDRVPLAVRAEGDLLAFQSALVVLAAQSPSIIVQAVNVQTVGVVKADTAQRLAVQFDLYVLRSRP